MGFFGVDLSRCNVARRMQICDIDGRMNIQIDTRIGRAGIFCVRYPSQNYDRLILISTVGTQNLLYLLILISTVGTQNPLYLLIIDTFPLLVELKTPWLLVAFSILSDIK